MKLKWTEILAVIGSLLLITAVIMISYAKAKEVSGIPDPNEIRQIVMPKAVEIPVKYKCPVHGVTEAVLTIEVDEIRKIYCKKCALNLIVNFFDLNLPRLEVEK